MKLRNLKCDSTNRKKYNILLYRQLRRYCHTPASLLFPIYGGMGVRCEFRKATELEELYTRDHVDQMIEPFLARKDDAGNFSRENCYFMESKITVQRFINKVYGWETSGKESLC